MWLLLLTVTVTCMCASPRCKSSATSLSFSAYCQKLCMWGRGGNLCHCNAMHFVGKRHDSVELRELEGQRIGSDVDEQAWNNDDDDDDEAGSDAESSATADDDRAGLTRRRRPQSAILVALRRLDRRRQRQLLRDGAKKGERDEPLVADGLSSEDDAMTLNALARRPATLRLLPAANVNQHAGVLPKTSRESRCFPASA